MKKDPPTTAGSVSLRVGAALFFLLALTMATSFINLGPFNFVAIYTIAFAKALLVALFFMELRHSRNLIWILAAAGVIWLALLIGGTLGDVLTRSTLTLPFR